jgi:hypothetical protein
MASTQITVENRTDIRIYALLTWAGGHIGGVEIQPRPGGAGPGPSGNIPCEYVWYDLQILDPSKGFTRDVTGVVGGHGMPGAEKSKQARGGTSWIFERTEKQEYRLSEHP